MMLKKSLYTAWLITFATALAAMGQQLEIVPFSENIELHGDRYAVILAYPKYKRSDDGRLVEIDTKFQPSRDAAWDYEVTAGIWDLRLSLDGIYQVIHEGDVFTFGFESIGIDRGGKFEPLFEGEPSWGRYHIIGDVIEWQDVYPGVHFRIKYVQDLLKVDVIVTKELAQSLKEDIRVGALERSDLLTVRFAALETLIRSEMRYKDERVSSMDTILVEDADLTFERDGEVLRRFPKAYAYPVDENREQIYSRNGEAAYIPASMTVNLDASRGGYVDIAMEMSEFADEEILGDYVIDPTIDFDYTKGIQDTRLRYNCSTCNYGSDSILNLEMSGSNSTSDRLIYGFNIANSEFLERRNIVSARLYLRITYAPGSSLPVIAYEVNQDWLAAHATWTKRTSTLNWAQAGGMSNSKYGGRSTVLPTSTGEISVDVTNPFKRHFKSYSPATNPSDMFNKGLAVKYHGSGNVVAAFASSSYSTTSYRPKLVIEYKSTEFAVYPGPADVSLSLLQNRINDANTSPSGNGYPLLRYLDHPNYATSRLSNFASYSHSGQKVFVHAPIGDIEYNYPNATSYKNHVMTLLNGSSTHINSGKIAAIELGGEEEDKAKWWEPSFTPPLDPHWFGDQINGASYAKYYVEAFKEIKASYPNLLVFGGGAVEKHQSFTYTDSSNYGSVKQFLRGFIDEVKTQAIDDGESPFDYLPDVLTIHSYSGKLPPEMGFVNQPSPNGKIEKEWFTRLKEILDIADEYNWIPNVGTTEYGFSPTPNANNHWAPTGASEVSQAVYYLRSSLMNATMKPYTGQGWHYSSYFTHPMGVYQGQNTYEDFGFRGSGAGLGAKRAIWIMADKLIDPDATQPLSLFDPGNKVWLPLERDPNGPELDDNEPKEGYAWCG